MEQSLLSRWGMPDEVVVHIITGLSTGGAEHMLEKLVSSHSQRRYKPIVISLGDTGPVGKRLVDAGVVVEALQIGQVISPVAGYRRLRALLRKLQPRLVQGWMYHGNVAATASTFFGFSGVPVIWNVRMSLDDLMIEKRSTVRMMKFSVRISRYAAAIVYNSQRSANQHKALGYNPRRTVVIPNGFDCSIFQRSDLARISLRQELGLPTDAILIGQIGRFHPMKDPENFLDAAVHLLEAVPGAHFVLAGLGADTANPQLTQMLSGRAIADRVHCLGERADIPRITAALDIATLASCANEGFPNVLGEAMACEVPCVATDVGDVAELLGDTGIVVAPRNSVALAAAWRDLVAAGADRRSSLGAAGRQRILGQYSMTQVRQRYDNLYDTLISGCSAGTACAT